MADFADYPAGSQWRFKGEPHPETGELRHLGNDGEVHVLAGDVSADTGAPVGWGGDHPLQIGAIGTVMEGHDLNAEGQHQLGSSRIPAAVSGAGSDTTDCLNMSFPSETPATAYLDAEGNPQKAPGIASFRVISFELPQLEAWFEPAVEIAPAEVTPPAEVAAPVEVA